MDNYDFMFKVVLVGNKGTGKTTLLNSLSETNTDEDILEEDDLQDEENSCNMPDVSNINNKLIRAGSCHHQALCNSLSTGGGTGVSAHKSGITHSIAQGTDSSGRGTIRSGHSQLTALNSLDGSIAHSHILPGPGINRHVGFSQSMKNPATKNMTNNLQRKTLHEHFKDKATIGTIGSSLSRTSVNSVPSGIGNGVHGSSVSIGASSSASTDHRRSTKSNSKMNDVTVTGMYKKISGQNIFIQLWDTFSSERYMALNKSYFRTALGAVILYDITDASGLEQAQKWLTILKSTAKSKLTILLIGNKVDLEHERKISISMGQEFAKVHGLLFCECSNARFIDYDNEHDDNGYVPGGEYYERPVGADIDRCILNEFYTRMYLRKVD